MTQNYMVLNSVEHRGIRVSEKNFVAILEQIGNCNIIADEIFSAASSFPIFFIKDEQTGAFNLSVIFALKNNTNLFVDQMEWAAPYLPLNMKRHPLAISNKAGIEDVGAYDIYIDTNSSLLSEKSGVRLFDENGSETDFLKDRKRILGALIQGAEKTSDFINTLLEHELVFPLTISLTTLSGSEKVSGLYGIDHIKMKNINHNIYIKLINDNMLELVYLIKASYAQINRLVWLENKKTANTILKYSILS